MTARVSNNMICRFCLDSGKSELEYTSHTVRSRGITVCPILLETKCSYCNKKGHIKNYCPLAKKDSRKKHVSHVKKSEKEVKTVEKSRFAALEESETEEEEEEEEKEELKVVKKRSWADWTDSDDDE